MASRSPRFSGWPGALGLLFGAYALGAGTDLLDKIDAGGLYASWWAASGLSVAVMALTPFRWWWLSLLGVAAAGGAAALTSGADDAPAAWSGVALALQAAAAGLVVRRLRDQPPRLESPRDLLAVLGAALTSGVLAGAAATVTVRGIFDLTVTGTDAAEVAVPFLAHVASVLVLLPLALAAWLPWRWLRAGEMAVQSSLLVAVCGLVFAPSQEPPLIWAVIPLLVWGAVRFDIRFATWQVAALAALTTVLTARGDGPLGSSIESGTLTAEQGGALLMGYVLSAALITLPLAILAYQRSDLLARVSADEAIARRNFTESLIGMAFLRLEGDRLVISDVNEAGSDILRGDRLDLIGTSAEQVIEILEPTTRVVEGLRSVRGWQGRATVPSRPGSRLNVAIAQLATTGGEPIFSAQLLDISKEHDARRQLENARQLTSATLDTVGCAIMVADTNGVIVRVNAATTEISGYPESELVGAQVWDTLISPLAQPDVEALFLWPNRSGSPIVHERSTIAKGGEPLRIVWNSNVVRDDQGLASYAVMTGIDVTSERASTGLMTHLMQASISTALIGIDTAGKITLLNSGAEQLLGCEQSDLVGEPFVGILDAQQLMARTESESPAQAFVALVEPLSSERETAARDWVWIDKQRGERVVSMTLSVTEDHLDHRVGFFCIGRDVTEQRASQEAIVTALERERAAVEQLRAVDRAKDEFVSTVSHELRTPVTNILGYTELLQDGSIVSPDPEQVPLLRTIVRNAERLVVICEDLLLLSGLDSGSHSHQTSEAVDVGSAVQLAEDSIQPAIKHRDLTVTFSRPDEPVVVLGQRNQLERLLDCLLTNAIKFTEDGGTITVGLTSRTDRAVLTVADSGMGIPADELDSVFSKFYQTTAAQHLAIPGTGLGLPIVAAIVEAHDGQISLESTPGVGTTVTVHLPLTKTPLAPSALSAAGG